ncbi:hypothetical protein DS901_14900 [Loktanella sp. D2R18]|uniref:hypothetical protein n=1 Tax=Rhodobacterales TaxID=204455 RepID=UPI000DE937D1|nr:MULTISPECIES: hypothetical protein [Rhodobacterales]MDO6588743.1 hypothetical protein [Yoonia sp. 1_MG-2023]RBW42022.1 hypothetical protein DS901_14900 [Loktanella sp. D2R18]
MGSPEKGVPEVTSTGADRTCPSARCEPGATLLGVKGEDGRINHLRTAMPIDAHFVDTARQAGPPEQRMRFASRCATEGCSQWTGSRCGVIDRVLTHLGTMDLPVQNGLPACPIRATCRWFDQTGAAACHACTYVTTDNASAHI